MWRPDELAVEARRNLGPAHAVLGVLAAAVIAAAIALVLLQGHRALAQEAERRAAGSLVWTATASDAVTSLDGTTCARLSTLPGVAAAGGQVSQAPTGMYAFPGARPLPVIGLTPGAVQVFAPTAPWAATTVGADLAALGEIGPGSWLVDSTGARVVQIDTLLGSAPVGALSSAVTIPAAPDAPLDACWLRMQPAAVAYGRDVLLAAYPGGAATITPFVREQAGQITPLQQWERTIALRPWLAAGAVIAVTAGLLLWSRRTELAIYRAFGTPRSALLALVTTELTLVLIPALAGGVLLASVAFAAWTRTGAPGPLIATALAQGVAAALLGLAVALVPAVLVTRGGLTDVLRDR